MNNYLNGSYYNMYTYMLANNNKCLNINTMICNNCGKQGHMFHQCKMPIISYGIILFKNSLEGLQFLMLRRKDSFGYIDFIRGKYSLYNLNQIINIIDEMSIAEKHKILTVPFETLWSEMWSDANSYNQYKNEEFSSNKKFENLKEGILIGYKMLTIKNIIEMSQTSWNETEWEFPKGRRNPKEKDLDCALREFEEETGINANDITIIENMLPFEEIFIGSNHQSYKHKYFLACMEHPTEANNNLNNFQKTEVSKLEWKTLDKCLESIRPYNLEKKHIITNINKVLQEYRLYS
jgi:8-oxo-dGTP pyrophosphatase MutT (NUDIX family)